MSDETPDIVAKYGLSRGWHLYPRSVLVEGTSDVSLFKLAANLFRKETGKKLLADLAIIEAGDGDRGGARGVIRELVTLRNLATAHLSPSGNPIYRVIALFDNDTAGQKSINGARSIDSSILEYRDVFRLHPNMPKPANLDPTSVRRAFENENKPYKGLNWELEDLISEPLISLFLESNETALISEEKKRNRIHREFTKDGKSKLIRFCNQHSDLDSLNSVIQTIHSLRHYLFLPDLSQPEN